MTEIGDKQREDVLARLMGKGLTRGQAEEKIASYLKQKAAPADDTEAKAAPVSQAPIVATGDNKDTKTMTDTTEDTTTEAAATEAPADAKPAKAPKAPKAPKPAKAPRTPVEPHESLWLPLFKGEMAALDAYLATLPVKTSRAKWAKALVLDALKTAGAL